MGAFVSRTTASSVDYLVSSGLHNNATWSNSISLLWNTWAKNGFLPRLPAMWPFGGDNAASQAYNLMDPRNLDVAFRLSFLTASGGTAGTHSATGWKPSGSSYANTYLVPVRRLRVMPLGVNVYLRTNDISNYDIGASSDAFYLTLITRYGNNKLWLGVSSSELQTNTSVTDARGHWLVQRTNATTIEVYHNGTLFDTITTSPVAVNSLPVNPLILGGASFGTGDIGYFSTREQAMAGVQTEVFSAAEVLEFYNSIQAHMIRVGRNVY